MRVYAEVFSKIQNYYVAEPDITELPTAHCTAFWTHSIPIQAT